MQCSEEHLGSARALACWRWRPRHRGLLFPPGNLFPPAAPGKVRFGLTWLYRLASEPARLGPRYLKYNFLILYYLMRSVLRGRGT